ncbi:MAG: type II toxin-antitoxin system RelE/ParE family toxin [Elusimicrobiota bacterium]|jgi:putative addiction module killer protein|nr:type II toxin-antitoxin system RelE/ParE family toxin [Elusimicrobiota bacterium]
MPQSIIEIRQIPLYTKWFEKQTKEIRENIANYIDKIKKGDTSHCENKRGGISEIKIDFGQGVRVYYIVKNPAFFVLVWGGADKKRQTADIEKAVKIRNFMAANKQI